MPSYLELNVSMKSAYFSDFKVKDFFEVHGLWNNEQIEGPRPTEVGYDDGVHGHGGEESFPRRRLQIGHRRLDVGQWIFDVAAFATQNGRVQTRLLERQPRPEQVPDQPEQTCRTSTKQMSSAPCNKRIHFSCSAPNNSFFFFLIFLKNLLATVWILTTSMKITRLNLRR